MYRYIINLIIKRECVAVGGGGAPKINFQNVNLRDSLVVRKRAGAVLPLDHLKGTVSKLTNDTLAKKKIITPVYLY